MTVIGIDLAAQPVNTGVVVLDRVTGPDDNVDPGQDRSVQTWAASVVTEPATDEVLVELCRDADRIGVDAPLGWPVDFVRAVTAHDAGLPWPGTVDRRPLTHRCTDDVVVELGWGRPMSASADKLGSVAMRAALLQTAWAQHWGTPAPRDGTGRIAEVYPAAAVRRWQLIEAGVDGSGGGGAGGGAYKGTGAKRAAALEVRDSMVRVISKRCPWLDVSAVHDRAVASDHVLDALLCALITVAVGQGATLSPRDERERRLARVEGWIHVPTEPLDQLVPPLPPAHRD